ncbi:unnamed protein product [Clonostachys byssicola]|uniref:Uncharacterized protein n=1 Tax=Clonostachys byssicola TaxID=160290 RepID=A0A9N9XZ42_9HYPO|nr:unnamed protein product [Clonostachys byssicola]
MINSYSLEQDQQLQQPAGQSDPSLISLAVIQMKAINSRIMHENRVQVVAFRELAYISSLLL